MEKNIFESAITNEASYDAVMEEINRLQKIGEANLTKKEFETIRSLALKAQAYEESIYTIPAPQTLEGMIELRMYEMKLKQGEVAKLLGISDAKFSLILNGKRRPDIPFLQALHSRLHIDADFLLQHA